MKKSVFLVVFLLAMAVFSGPVPVLAGYDIKITEPEKKDGYGDYMLAGLIWWDDYKIPHGLIKPLNNTPTSVPQDHPVWAYVKGLLDNPPPCGESGWKVFPYYYSSQGTPSPTFCPVVLVQIVAGDFDGNGAEDLAGVDAANNIFYTLDLANWQQIPGKLSHLATGDLTGDGKDDIVGVTPDGMVFFSKNLADFEYVAGQIQKIDAGDINGDGIADIVGINNGVIYWTPNKGKDWFTIPNPVQ